MKPSWKNGDCQGSPLGYPAVLVDGALILDDEDEVKAGQDGALQVYVLLCRLQVVVPSAHPQQ